MNCKALLLAAFMVAMLTGVHYSLAGSSLIVNMVVGTVYFLGIFGVYMMYESRLCKDGERKLLLLLVGFIGVLIAYFSLETLYRGGIK